MLIANIMLSRGFGGIQQSFLDYNTALESLNIKTINIISVKADVKQYLSKRPYQLLNLGKWDLLSIYQLRRYFKRNTPDIIICHGNRAIDFTVKSNIYNITVIGVAHNETIKSLQKCNYVIALTDYFKRLLAKYYNSNNIFVIPNMITIDTEPILFRELGDVPIIGTLGRFVPKKGFNIFLKSLKILKDLGHRFKAVIGGDGEENASLRKLCDILTLDEVKFIGWVKNKDSFFKSIDIFCMPSLHEPFGIVVLEAMKYSKPIIATYTEGPQEIILDNHTGLLCEPNSPQSLAAKLAILISDQQLCMQISNNAYNKVKSKYNIEYVAHDLRKLLLDIYLNRISTFTRQ